ncbi:MAG: PGPGW domain-containing protein [Spirochaetales bacterium]|nr:PGPGW domain-containing protein [Spirochaetales bacterium]
MDLDLFDFSRLFDILAEHKRFFFYFSLASFVVFVVSLLSMPYLIAKIPEDYFSKNFSQRRERRQFSGRFIIFSLIKNLIGSVILLGGVIMLFVPGQGLLTIFAGMFVMDFPGKHRLEAWFLSKPSVQDGLNFFRKKMNKQPFDFSMFCK